MDRLGVLLLRWFGAAQEHAAFKFQLAPLKFAGAARRQGGFSADGFNNPKLQLLRLLFLWDYPTYEVGTHSIGE